MDTMMDTFLSYHGKCGVKQKFYLTKRVASQQGLKALETSTSRKELHTEDEKDFIQEFLDESVKFREIFPNGEDHLLHISTEFFDDYFKTVNLSLQPDSGEMLAAELNISFRQLLLDVSRMNELFPRANLLDRSGKCCAKTCDKAV